MKDERVGALTPISMPRLQILRATIECILKNGYASLTMRAICSLAGISRGAMMNHFASKAAVTTGTIHYLYENRFEAFRKAIQKNPTENDDLRHAIYTYWDHVNEPDFAACIELAAAARTDAALSAVLIPAQREFETNLLRVCFENFPSWTPKGEHFSLGLKLSRALIERTSLDWLPSLGNVPRAVIFRSLEQMLQQLRATDRSTSISSLRTRLS